MRLPELDKPLAQFTSSDFYDLCYELQEDMWLEREKSIEEAVDRFMETRARHMPCGPSGLPPYCFAAPTRATCYGSSPAAPAYRTIVVDIPYQIPPEYVRPMAEQLIREQIYPQED